MIWALELGNEWMASFEIGSCAWVPKTSYSMVGTMLLCRGRKCLFPEKLANFPTICYVLWCTNRQKIPSNYKILWWVFALFKSIFIRNWSLSNAWWFYAIKCKIGKLNRVERKFSVWKIISTQYLMSNVCAKEFSDRN